MENHIVSVFFWGCYGHLGNVQNFVLSLYTGRSIADFQFMDFYIPQYIPQYIKDSGKTHT